MKKTKLQTMKGIFKMSFSFVLVVGVCIFTFNFMVKRSSADFLFDSIETVPNKKTALVLGSNKYSLNGGINPYFQYRITAAYELYKNKKVNQLIVSGDNHSTGYDETTAMAESLIELGVPDSCIIRDYAGFRTLDSVVRAKKVFNCNELIIVSQKFHNERAFFIARHYGIDAVGFNSQDMQHTSNYTHYREIGAKFLMVLDLYCFNTQPKFLK